MFMLLPPRLQTAMMKLPLHVVLLWFRGIVMMRFLCRAPRFLAFPPLPFAPDLPCRPAAMAHTLSALINLHLFLLLL
jgi:hypothetical protein